MAYRNGTYVAFHANGTNIPGKSDIDYYNLMKAWTAKTDDEFTMNNSHDKASAVRDSSRKATLRASLLERLKNSKNMVLIIGETTLLDDDWVPFEIEKAVDVYKIPIIVAYSRKFSGHYRFCLSREPDPDIYLSVFRIHRLPSRYCEPTEVVGQVYLQPYLYSWRCSRSLHPRKASPQPGWRARIPGRSHT